MYFLWFRESGSRTTGAANFNIARGVIWLIEAL
jgi:hypothetical protein